MGVKTRVFFVVSCLFVSSPMAADELAWVAPSSGGFFNNASSWKSLGGAHGVTPKINDTVLFDNSFVSYTPALVVVPAATSFNVGSISDLGLNTFIALNGSENTVNLSVLVTAGLNGDNPVSLTLAGDGGINAFGSAFIGTYGGVNSSLLVTNNASFGADSLNLGAESTTGALVANLSSVVNANSAVVGNNNGTGLLALDSAATLNVKGFGGVTLGLNGGTGEAAVTVGGSIHLVDGPLTVGGTSGTGALTIQGAFPTFGTTSIVSANSTIAIGAINGTGSVTVGFLGVLETTGTLVIGAYNPGSNGALTVSGEAPGPNNLDGRVSAVAGVIIGGNGGSGAVNLQSYGTLTTTDLVVGQSGGNGSLVASGAGSQVVVNGFGQVLIGAGGNGTVAINADASGAASLNTSGVITIGSGDGAKGLMSVTGGVDSQGVTVGQFGGTGFVQITGNGSVRGSGPNTIGIYQGSNAAIVLKDSGVFFSPDSTAASIVFGNALGSGSLDASANSTLLSFGTVTFGLNGGTGAGKIADSALLAAATIRLGDAGTGLVSIDGSGLAGGRLNLLTTTQLVVGANGGNGTLLASDAARMSAEGDVIVAVDKGSVGTLSLQSGTVFSVTGNLTAGSTMSGGGKAVIAVDNSTMSVANGLVGQGGDVAQLVVQNGGKFNSSGALTVGGNGQLLATDSGTLVSVSGNLAVSGAPVANSNVLAIVNGAQVKAGSVTIGTGGGTGTVEVSGAGSLLKSAGKTDIGGGGGNGILFLTQGGTLTSGGDVTVHAGGLLHGVGAVTGNVVNAGGTIQPGSSPGNLTINGDYTQTAGVLKFEIFGSNPADWDHLTINGDADFTGGIIDLSFFYMPACCTEFDLISVSGLGSFSGVQGIEIEGLPNFDYVTSFSDGTFKVEAVPEPRTWILVGIGLLAFFVIRRSVVLA